MARMTGSCHCGAVKLEFQVPDGLATARRCDCSMCRRRGAIVISVALEDLDVTGAEHLTCYTFNTHEAQHYFCKHCGIYTHHRRRSNPSQFGVNTGIIEGLNPRDLTTWDWVDAVNNPRDAGIEPSDA